MRKTAVALCLLAAALCASPGFAQQAPDSLDQVYKNLSDLQDANLGIARQMAALEQQAANELEGALEAGAIVNSAHQAIARTFVTNARTLATIMLSPMQTYQTAAGETMFVLVRRNIDLLKGITAYRAADKGLDSAITRYTVLQMQTQDMAMALQNGWTRYADIITTAEKSGLLANNTFDPDTQSWSIGTPVVASLPPVAAASPQPAPTATTTTAEAVTPVTPAAPDLSASVTPLVVPDIAPPVTTTAEAAAPPVAEPPAEPEPVVATAEPQPEPADESKPDTDERLQPEGPLEVADIEPTIIQMGDWQVATDATGQSVATAVNLVGETRDNIVSLSMSCAPDKSVEYVVNAAKNYPAYKIYSDRSQNVTVAAEGNSVAGEEAKAMAKTLAAAVAWAQQVPDSGRSLTLRTADSDGVLALFPPAGYADARAAMEAACANPTAPVVTAAAEPQPTAPAETPEPAAIPEPAETPITAPTQEATGPETVAPIPRPRLDRSRLPAPPPAEPTSGVGQPLNIM